MAAVVGQPNELGQLAVDVSFSGFQDPIEELPFISIPQLSEQLASDPLAVELTPVKFEEDGVNSNFFGGESIVFKQEEIEEVHKELSIVFKEEELDEVFKEPSIEQRVKEDVKKKGKLCVKRSPKKNETDGKESHPCPECGRIFSMKWNLLTHYRLHTGERPFHCTECDSTFRQLAHLQKHMRGVHKIAKVSREAVMKKPQKEEPVPIPEPEDPYKKFNLRDCEVALRRFDVEGDEPMDTTLILQKFKSMASNRKEVLLQIKTEDKKDCVVDIETDLLSYFFKPTRYSTTSSIIDTYRPRTTKMPVGTISRKSKTGHQHKMKKSRHKFKCSKCKRSFGYKSALAIHEKFHSKSGTNMAQINLGDQKTSKNMKLYNEVLAEDRKTLRCSICYKLFSSRQCLRAHMFLHTGLRPYKCETCGTRFANSGTLKTHIRLHTGERPYQCQTCKQRFIQLSSLNRHMQKYHSGGITSNAESVD